MTYSILFVENEPMLIEIYGLALRNAGFNVTLASSGQKAMQSLKDIPIDFVLLDMILPNESGLQILKSIKEQYPDVRVAMFTNLTAKREEALAYEIGAIGFLSKAQYTPRELAVKVDQLCKDGAQ